jgi:hypothetical protein
MLRQTKGHRFARWLRHRREFLLEELVAYRRMAMAVLVGIILLLLLMVLRMPRTTASLLRWLGL